LHHQEMIKTERQTMIYIHQYGHATLGWGETKEKAFQDATSICSDLKWEEIKDHTNMDGEIKDQTNMDGECYWSEMPEDNA